MTRLLCFLLFSASALAQAGNLNCSYGDMTLEGSTISCDVTGSGPKGGSAYPLTETRTFDDRCINDNHPPGTVYFDKSSSVQGNGQCIWGSSPYFYEHDCVRFDNQEIDGTYYTDPNQFYNRAYDGYGTYNPLIPQASCHDTGGWRQAFRQ